MADERILTPKQVGQRGLDDWRMIDRSLRTRWRTGDFATGRALLDGIADLAEAAGHHPDLDLRYPSLSVGLTTHDVGGVTERDLALAEQISELAGGMGVSADPRATVVPVLALDTPDQGRVAAFWRVIFDAETGPDDDELTIPGQLSPALWFQSTDDERAERQRFHVDVAVAADRAEAMLARALEAGGELVSDAAAPEFWVLADADGNRACICTRQEDG